MQVDLNSCGDVAEDGAKTARRNGYAGLLLYCIECFYQASLLERCSR